MYDRPETAADNDALWSAFREFYGAGPMRLDRDAGLEAGWTDPDLILSQTCGLPYRLGLAQRVKLVGCPDFRLPDTPPGQYHSVVIARAGDTRKAKDLLNARVVVNETTSQSGMNALATYADGLGVAIHMPQISGAHRASAQAVAEDRADIAAIDANTWRMITRWDRWSDTLTVVARTPNTPAMPFICGPHTDPGAVRDALVRAVETLSSDAKDRLGLYGIVPTDPAAFLAIAAPALPNTFA